MSIDQMQTRSVPDTVPMTKPIDDRLRLEPAAGTSIRLREPRGWRLLADSGPRRLLDSGSSLIIDGETAGALMLIQAGAVKLVGVAENGTTATVAVRMAGSAVGAFGPSSGVRYYNSAVAVVPTTVVTVSAQRVRAVIQGCPSLAMSLLECLGAGLHEAYQRMVDRVSYDATARICRVLLELDACFGDGGHGPGRPTVIPLIQQDIAGLAGVSREATAKVLRALREAGAVRTMRSRIVVDRPDLITHSG
jgi:CRP/FNR family transcriptional regulator, cyclic AMP receptor protein